MNGPQVPGAINNIISLTDLLQTRNKISGLVFCLLYFGGGLWLESHQKGNVDETEE